MSSFDLMSSEHFHVILHSNKKHGLIFNRLDGSMSTINYDDAKELVNLKLVGSIYGIVGHYLQRYLVLIKSRSYVGSLYEPRSKTNHDIYMINQVQVIDVLYTTSNSLSAVDSSNNTTTSTSNECPRISSVKYSCSNGEDSNSIGMTDLGESAQHQENSDFASLPITITAGSYASSSSRSGQWNPFKFANNLKPMVSRQFTKTSPSSEASSINSSNNDKSSTHSSHTKSSSRATQEDSDKRLVDEMIKLFNNTNSFYYSPTLDLTNRFSNKNLIRKSSSESVWRNANERFFWNKYMLKDLIELSERNTDANYFICVILQGFITIENRTLPNNNNDFETIEQGIPATSMDTLKILSGNSNCDIESTNSSETYVIQDNIQDNNQISKEYQLALISRRSVFQAGTRYRRRGCDEKGNVANFVETEQIIRFNQHFKSLVLIRGSIPLYWYQTGFNYRPPPVLVRSDEENHVVFTKHFEQLFQAYETQRIIAVDCTEKTGREKAIHDAYRRHTDQLSEKYPDIRLIEFDFHRHCRGRQCTDAQIERHLIDCGLSDQIMKEAKYYWNDGDVVLDQAGIFRVNCLDCSDRTNVVQRVIALKILDLQLARLGVITPDTRPEDNECRKIMQTLWSANGNVLSTQYCGTRALFGGSERKLSGYIKDTYSSASRYYISKFRDAYRQAAIDAMLGVESPEATNIKSGSLKDHYDLVAFDPMIASRSGGALLKDVGNRVSNRLARLKGRFYVRPIGMENIQHHDEDADAGCHDMDKFEEDEPELIGDGLDEALDKLNIDWPSSESVGGSANDQRQSPQHSGGNLFARLSQVDDCFQDDDEFGQLMLSIDVAELQRLRERNSEDIQANKSKIAQPQEAPEEIDMTETCGINSTKQQANLSSNETKTSTTST